MNHFNRMVATIAALTMLTLAQPLYAQKAGPNGGQIMGKDGYETELLVAATQLTVYLHEKGKPEDVKGAKFLAVTREAGKTTTVDFAVDGNKLVAKLPAPLGKGAIVVVSGTDGDNHMISSRYVIN